MSNNVSEVRLSDGRIVCLSYGVPVAAFLPGTGYVRRARRYSVTTSRHANSFAGSDSAAWSEEDFLKAIAPLDGR